MCEYTIVGAVIGCKLQVSKYCSFVSGAKIMKTPRQRPAVVDVPSVRQHSVVEQIDVA